MSLFVMIGLFFSTFCFGSVGGTAYAVGHGLSELATIFALCLINAAIVLIWFGVIGAVNSRLSGYLKSKRKDFRNANLTGVFALAGLSFVFGSLWAVIAVYALNMKRIPALISVTVLAVSGGTLWSLGSLGIIRFLPSPWIMYVVAMCAMSAIIVKKVAENQVLVKDVINNLVRRRT
ncbi:MAG: hypothetical protein KAV43_01330 [Hadesarchaea archaeon]|nr:hypothetical protein [Hadesarchaea archaeon]